MSERLRLHHKHGYFMKPYRVAEGEHCGGDGEASDHCWVVRFGPFTVLAKNFHKWSEEDMDVAYEYPGGLSYGYYHDSKRHSPYYARFIRRRFSSGYRKIKRAKFIQHSRQYDEFMWMKIDSEIWNPQDI